MASLPKTELEYVSNFAPSTREQLALARGIALHQYVHLESATYLAFSHAIGSRAGNTIDMKREQISMFAYERLISSSHEHRNLIKKIGQISLPDENQIFVKSLCKLFQSLSEQRNVIAHGESRGGPVAV